MTPLSEIGSGTEGIHGGSKDATRPPPTTSCIATKPLTLPATICIVGKTKLAYRLRAIEDLHAWLKEQGEWVALGAADEQKPAAPGTVEAWGRSEDNPVGGWYGLKKGLRGRFGMYMPPLLEALGLAELEHNSRNNRIRAL